MESRDDDRVVLRRSIAPYPGYKRLLRRTPAASGGGTRSATSDDDPSFNTTSSLMFTS